MSRGGVLVIEVLYLTWNGQTLALQREISSIGAWNGIPRVEPYIHWRQPGGGRNLLSDVESICVTFNNNCAHPCPPFIVDLWFVQTLISHALVAVFKRLRLKAMVLQRSLRGTYLHTYIVPHMCHRFHMLMWKLIQKHIWKMVIITCVGQYCIRK